MTDRKIDMRRGPRTHEEKMTRGLTLAAEIAAGCPPLAELIDHLAQQAVSPADLDERLGKVRTFLETEPVSFARGNRGADTGDRVVTHAQRYADASTRMAMINKALAAILSARRVIRAELDSSWVALKGATLKAADPISASVIEVARELVAAGVTGKQISQPATRARVKMAVKPSGGAPSTTASPTRIPVPMPLPQLQAMWRTLPNPIPGYTFTERDLKETGSSGTELAFYLPPFTSLDQVAPGTGLRLQALGSNLEKYDLALETMTDWALRNNYTRPGGQQAAQMRAWCFVLGYAHGFLSGVDKLDRVTLTSPWSNKALEVRRV